MGAVEGAEKQQGMGTMVEVIHMWLVEWQEMTKCVFCVLCVFVFFYLSKIFWTARVLCVFVFFFRFTTSKFTSQDQYFMCFLCFFYLLIFVIVACVLCVFCVFFSLFSKKNS